MGIWNSRVNSNDCQVSRLAHLFWTWAGLARARPLGYKPPLQRRPAMKEKIHPDYHEITVVMTDGTSFKTRSTWGKAGETINLEVDPKSHPAWTGVHRLSESGGQLAKLKKRFQNLGIKQ